jgi:hypothetical protein
MLHVPGCLILNHLYCLLHVTWLSQPQVLRQPVVEENVGFLRGKLATCPGQKSDRWLMHLGGIRVTLRAQSKWVGGHPSV